MSLSHCHQSNLTPDEGNIVYLIEHGSVVESFVSLDNIGQTLISNKWYVERETPYIRTNNYSCRFNLWNRTYKALKDKGVIVITARYKAIHQGSAGIWQIYSLKEGGHGKNIKAINKNNM